MNHFEEVDDLKLSDYDLDFGSDDSEYYDDLGEQDDSDNTTRKCTYCGRPLEWYILDEGDNAFCDEECSDLWFDKNAELVHEIRESQYELSFNR